MRWERVKVTEGVAIFQILSTFSEFGTKLIPQTQIQKFDILVILHWNQFESADFFQINVEYFFEQTKGKTLPWVSFQSKDW